MSLIRILQRSQTCSICTARSFSSTSAPLSKTTPEKPKKAQTNAATPVPSSSCAQDTVITGVNYLKGQPLVLARADEEYPDWLWTVLQPKVWPDDGPGGKAERVQRRNENRQRIKDRNFMSTQ